MAVQKYRLKVNGKKRFVKAEPNEPLMWVLRDALGLTGTKYGCGEGECGSCAVLMDGEAVRSCLVKVSDAVGADIVTIEGIADGKKLSPLQKAFIENGAFACGFCTPGMIIVATALLGHNPNPTREEIVDAMDKNLCRCGGYLNMIEAIESVTNGEVAP